jgi:chitinase
MDTLFSTAIQNGVEPVLSVGGWGFGSSRFSEMVASNETRAAFINSLHPLVEQYAISGLDIDWEYPGRFSADNVPFDETSDVPNYLLLLEELRLSFGNTITLSAAVAAATPFASDVSGFAAYFDWVGLMVYDYATGDLTETTADAPLTESPVMTWFNASLPKEKMVFGLPSYGRSFTLKDV